MTMPSHPTHLPVLVHAMFAMPGPGWPTERFWNVTDPLYWVAVFANTNTGPWEVCRPSNVVLWNDAPQHRPRTNADVFLPSNTRIKEASELSNQSSAIKSAPFPIGARPVLKNATPASRT